MQTLTIAPLLTAALLVGTGGAPTPTASNQAPASGSVTSPTAPQGPVTIKAQPVAYVSAATLRAQRGRLAVKIAAAQRGKPYRYGGTGPSSFDCSGLIYYVYKKRIGYSLPRTANAQRAKAVGVGKQNVQAGDLVFFMSGGRAYHVGVYAGGGKVWHSPKPGQRVQLSKIWTSRWQAGRLR